MDILIMHIMAIKYGFVLKCNQVLRDEIGLDRNK